MYSSSTVICCEFSDDFELISNKKKENLAHEVLFNDFDSHFHTSSSSNSR